MPGRFSMPIVWGNLNRLFRLLTFHFCEKLHNGYTLAVQIPQRLLAMKKKMQWACIYLYGRGYLLLLMKHFLCTQLISYEYWYWWQQLWGRRSSMNGFYQTTAVSVWQRVVKSAIFSSLLKMAHICCLEVLWCHLCTFFWQVCTIFSRKLTQYLFWCKLIKDDTYAWQI